MVDQVERGTTNHTQDNRHGFALYRLDDLLGGAEDESFPVESGPGHGIDAASYPRSLFQPQIRYFRSSYLPACCRRRFQDI